MTIDHRRRPYCRVLHSVPAIITAAVAVGVFAAVATFQRRGFNFLDESYVWSLIANPDASRTGGEVYLFGFVLNPLYQWVDGSIHAYRILGLTITTVLCALLATEVASFADRDRNGPRDRLTRAAFIITTAAFSTVVFAYGNRVLSYNSLAICGLILACIGIIKAARDRTLVGGLTIGTAAWIVFTAKPTTAAGLVIVGTAAIVLMNRSPWKVLTAAAGAGTFSAVITLALMRMTPADLIAYLSRGVEHVTLLGSYRSVSRILGFTVPQVAGLLVFGLPLFVITAVWWRATGAPSDRFRSSKNVTAVTALVAVTTLLITYFNQHLAADERGVHMRTLPLLIPVLTLGLAATMARRSAASRWRTTRDDVALVALLLLLPYVYALGSNIHFSFTMSYASVCWVVALGFAALRWFDQQTLLIGTAASACALSVVALTSLTDGAPHESLLAASEPVDVAGTALLVPEADARVMRQLDDVRARHRITNSTPVVDLTGIGPGYALQLGGRPLGRASFMGVFPGAEKAARWSLGLETCADRAAAWILVSDNNPLDVTSAMLVGGLDLRTDYQPVLHFRPTQGPDEWRTVDITVLKPSKTVIAKLGCRN